MDDLIVQYRKKEYTYQSNNPTILVIALVMGASSFSPYVNNDVVILWLLSDKESFYVGQKCNCSSL